MLAFITSTVLDFQFIRLFFKKMVCVEHSHYSRTPLNAIHLVSVKTFGHLFTQKNET